MKYDVEGRVFCRVAACIRRHESPKYHERCLESMIRENVLHKKHDNAQNMVGRVYLNRVREGDFNSRNERTLR